MESSLASEYGRAWGDTPAAHALADRIIEEQEGRGPGLNGAQFLLTPEEEVDALWGWGNNIFWARGEPLMLAGGPGVGKSTLAQQLCLRRAGVHGGDLLGFPVTVGEGRVLYVAADRPRQIRRSWRRMVNEEDRAELARHVVVYEGSPPFRISSNPEAMLPWVRSFEGVDTVFIDAYLDLGRLSEEGGSAAANDALQELIRNDIEVCVVHHDRKLGNEGRKLVRLDDIYGGRNVTKGMGSVVYLDGDAGDLKARLIHLKPPAYRIPSFEVAIDPLKGETYKTYKEGP